MKVLLIIFICLATNAVFGQQVAVLKYEALKERIELHDKKTVLVKFWATWCVPCIEELPLLMQMQEKYRKHEGFKMILVSLDSKKNLNKLPEFLQKHQVKAEVVLLDDNKRMNEWIPAFDAKCQGNLPATIIYHKGQKVAFIEEAITGDQLNTIANKYLEPSK